MNKNLREKIKKLPCKAGVYFFKDKKGQIIYIGKAKNLKKRVLSHFSADHQNFLSFSEKIFDLDFLKTDNEKEALILENEFIKKIQPRYNIALKDDKNFFFVVFSKELWPRVYLTHQPQNLKKTQIFGPFIKGKELKKYLSLLRKIFPFRSCKNFSKKCLYFDLKLCPAPCIKENQRSKRKLQKYLLSLEALKQFLKIYLSNSDRVEAYDISHISGKFIVGAMIVFKKNRPQKSEYRKFKIKTIKKANDILALKEILLRRMKHQEWPLPKLIVLDGGRAQLKAASWLDIPVIGLAKISRIKGKIYSPFGLNQILTTSLPSEVENFFLFLRDEAHRFAISYHHLKRKKSLFMKEE